MTCNVGGYFTKTNGLIYLADPTLKMDDTDYLRLINAKIVANNASGTIRDFWYFLTDGLGLDGASGALDLVDNVGWLDAQIIENDLLSQFDRYLINKIGPRAAGVTNEVKNWTLEYLDFTRYANDPSKFYTSGRTIDGEDSKVLICSGAGLVTWVPIVYNYRILTGEAAYGQWDTWIAKTGTSDLWFMPIAATTSPHNDVSQSGYALNITASEEIRLYKITAGASVQLFSTAVSYVDTSYHKYTVTRDSATNTFTVYVDDVIATASAGTNPVVDSTHTTSVYTTFEPNLSDEMGLVTLADVRLTDYQPE